MLRRFTLAMIGLLLSAQFVVHGQTLSNQTYGSGTTGTIQGTALQAGPALIIQANAAITLQASSSIALLPGFDAQPGSAFTAIIGSSSAIPSITSASSASGSANSTFSFTVTASANPTSFAASGLPSGLSINSSTGVISGTTTASGTFAISVAASNASGTGIATLTLTIGNAAQAAVSIQPTGPLNVVTGQTVTFSAGGGSGTGAYVWGGAGSGTGPTLAVTFSQTGTQTVTVYRAADSNDAQSNTASVTINVGTLTNDPNNTHVQLKLLTPPSAP